MEQEQVTHTRDSLKVKVLTQRIATLVAQYEELLADLRAQATLEIDTLNSRVNYFTNALNEERANSYVGNKSSVIVDERPAEILDVETQEVPD